MPKKLLLVKKPLPPDAWATDVLTFFHVAPENYNAPSEVDVRTKRPSNAPVITFPEVLVRACLATLAAWGPE